MEPQALQRCSHGSIVPHLTPAHAVGRVGCTHLARVASNPGRPPLTRTGASALMLEHLTERGITERLELVLVDRGASPRRLRTRLVVVMRRRNRLR